MSHCGHSLTIRFLLAVLLVPALAWLPGQAGAAQPPADAELREAVAAYKRGNYFNAREQLRPLAEQGIAEAQMLIGKMYASGRAVAMDGGAAAKWFRLAAEQDNAEAQYRLALMYEGGWGVAQDREQARMWLSKAADLGHAKAKKRLATYPEPAPARSAGASQPAALSKPAATPTKPAAETASKAAPARAARPPAASVPKASPAKPVAPRATRVPVAPEPKRPAEKVVKAPASSEPKPRPSVEQRKQAQAEPKPIRVKREAWALSRDPGHFTVQLMGAWSEQEIRDFIREHDLEDGVAYVRSRRRGKPWYSLLYGEFPTAKAAEDALRALPRSLKRAGPWPRTFRAVQASIKREP